MDLEEVRVATSSIEHGGALAIQFRMRIDAPICFAPDLALEIFDPDGACIHASNLRSQVPANWLPRGRFLASLVCGSARIRLGHYRVRVVCSRRRANLDEVCAERETAFTVNGSGADAGMQCSWQLMSEDGGPDLASLSWNKGHGDWFFRHFDHAAETIISYMLGDSPLLRGRILDVGCGDGITDLGVALRCEPELLIGVDPFRGYQRLDGILESNGLPAGLAPASLRYMDADGNHLPFPDDSFDVVLSWGSLEHIAGGYLQTLREIKRVLRDGGLFFVHPGLFYSNFGHHLGEFSSEPFFHLTKSREELKQFVLSSTPDYIDRSGEFASPAQYWQWFEELNPITVSEFERELRALEFEPWRVALRTEDRIEYTPELLRYPMHDLATAELYMSCINRKQARPGGYLQRDPASV